MMSCGAENVLNKGGLFLDDVSKKIRLIHPDTHQSTQEIVGECEEYLQVSKNCSTASEKLVESLQVVAEIADRERMQVIGRRSRLLIKNIDGTSSYQQMKAAIQDRNYHFDHLTQHHESLLRVEQEMEETLLWLSKK